MVNAADLIPRSIGQVAQSVEQRIENPRVGSSILPLATNSQPPRFVSDADLPTRVGTTPAR
jgi:hypothetical protein